MQPITIETNSFELRNFRFSLVSASMVLHQLARKQCSREIEEIAQDIDEYLTKANEIAEQWKQNQPTE